MEASERALAVMKHGMKAYIGDTFGITASFKITHPMDSRNAEKELVLCDQRLTRTHKQNFKNGMTEATPWTP
jgi:hypothetical protein